MTGLSALQRRQYEIQREWFANGDVPAVELILWSKGLLNLQEGESYAVMLGGLMVSRCCVALQEPTPLLTRLLCSAPDQPRQCGECLLWRRRGT